ncbi:MAG: response regulator [Candidatus Nitrosopolaris wilkensis]|nr:MAG: response regulator [Candidatus Nitrosopolaris wilkensis]
MKVLIVDDDEELTSAVKDFLDSTGIECKVKNEGKEGLDEILTQKGTYDLILLDIAMPQFSGYDVLERLKTEGLLKSENIVIFTASSITGKSMDNFLAAGAKEILKKPVSLDELTQLIEKYRP